MLVRESSLTACFTCKPPRTMKDRPLLNGIDLPQSILEMAALEAYREGRITTFQLRELLGLSRMEIDGFLKERGVYLDYTVEELEQDSAALEELLKRHNPGT